MRVIGFAYVSINSITAESDFKRTLTALPPTLRRWGGQSAAIGVLSRGNKRESRQSVRTIQEDHTSPSKIASTSFWPSKPLAPAAPFAAGIGAQVGAWEALCNPIWIPSATPAGPAVGSIDIAAHGSSNITTVFVAEERAWPVSIVMGVVARVIEMH